MLQLSLGCGVNKRKASEFGHTDIQERLHSCLPPPGSVSSAKACDDLHGCSVGFLMLDGATAAAACCPLPMLLTLNP